MDEYDNGNEIKTGKNESETATEGVVGEWEGKGERTVKMLYPTDRSVIKTVLYGILTLGIYVMVMMYRIGKEMNDVATKHDGKKTMNYFLVTFILSPLTLGIAMLVWQHRLSQRVGDELSLRKIEYDYDEKCFWTWGVLGAVILIGPLVHAHKFLRAMNLISESHNQGK